MYTNIQSIFNKRSELKVYLEINDIDIMFLTECFITDNYDSSEYSFTGYQVFVAKKNRGGACIFVKNSVPCYEVFPPNRSEDSCWLVITTRNNIKRLYICVYRSPNSTDVNNNKLLENIMWASRNYPEVLLIGDINLPSIDWCSNYSSNDYEMRFLDVLDEGGMEQMITEPTRYRISQSPSLLDLLVTSNPSSVTNIVISDPFGKSDHCRIEFSLKKGYEDPVVNRHRYNYYKIDENKFTMGMERVDWNDLKYGNLNEMFDNFTSIVASAIEESVPKMKPADRKIAPWSNGKIRKLSKKKRKLWDKYRHSTTQYDYNKYKSCLNEFNNEKSIAIYNYENNIICNKKTNPKKYHRYVSRKDRYAKQHIVLNCDGETSSEADRCAEILNDYFSSVYTAGRSNLDVDTSLIPDYGDINEINVSEALMSKIISELDANKSTGPDGIPVFLIQKFASIFSPILTEIFRRSYREGIVPASLKMANVAAIHKSGDKASPDNYRPISLTPVTAKIFEKVVKQSIEEHIAREQILSNKQHGFRQGRSTSSNLLQFTNDLANLANDSKSISIIYTDLRKAFDSVPHDLLLIKLRKYGIVGRTGRWIESFLSDRHQRVCIDSSVSSYQSVVSGVPQGAVLSGLLFSLYINDLPLHIKKAKISLYADDAKIYSPITSQTSIEEMQEDLNRMLEWCTEWRLNLNPNKCYQVQYNPRSNARRFDPIYRLGADTITRKQQVKDLGIIISDNLKFHDQVDEACKRANREINRIRRTFISRSPDFISGMYKLYVRPHLEYCIEVWNPQYQGDINKMEKVQNRMSRMMRQGNRLLPAQRNLALGITTHQQRRLRGDAINIFKNIENEELFMLRNNDRTRGHQKKLIHPNNNCNIKSHSFGSRAIGFWNSLPDYVIESSDVNAFKNNLDNYFLNLSLNPS